MANLVKFQRICNSNLAKNILKIMKTHKGQVYGKAFLTDLGGDLKKLTDFTKSYDNLVIENGRIIDGLPTRLRRYANFSITRSENENHFQQNAKVQFKQYVNDSRNKTRIFHTMESRFLNDIMLQTVFSSLTDLVWQLHNDAVELEMSIHQVRVLSYPNMSGDNAPEGIHQDGADVIVPVIVMNRSPHIKGAVSRTYSDDAKTLIDETIVQEGEFNFMQDRVLWHDVTKLDIDCS